MPVITQENGRKSVAGLPARWGVRAYNELKKAQGEVIGKVPEEYKKLSKLLDEVVSAPMEIDSTDSQICILAKQCADEAQRYKDQIGGGARLVETLVFLLNKRGIEPDTENEKKFIARACDEAYWRRNLRKVHGRIFEHAAIRLGFVSIRSGAYCSDETVRRHLARTRRNRNMLGAVKMQNQQTNQIFGLQELADKTTANTTIRRGELMLRMAGCEKIAEQRGDVGIFITRTMASKYHAMLAKSGELNPKYEGATPREAAEAMGKSWQKNRTALNKAGIFPYGFRMAEPHHDGCPHWHMLMFIRPDKMTDFVRICSHYALEEAPEEVAHDQSIRIKFEMIDPAKGSACGYLAKYVSKNIGDEHVTDHIDSDGVITPSADMLGDKIKPHHRVAAWASCWGIHQFQPIGQPPITVWREIRKIPQEKISSAPNYIIQAWGAAQRIESVCLITNEKQPIKAADFAEYINAQGGVCVGRKYRIGVAVQEQIIEGRYGLEEGKKPVGIYSRRFEKRGNKEVLLPALCIYESVRYTWKRISGGGEVAFTWSPVNNCTDKPEPGREAFWAKNLPIPEIYEFEPIEQPDCAVHWGWHQENLEAALICAEFTRAETVWTKMRGGH